ncbi:MAG TPA: hypothetical protein QF891_03885, partial [Rhodospirillales bacterium]|nr:hypothetical protein [Rhodospirillales bacterium]
PDVVYTWPEAASVGKTEEQLKEAGVAYAVGMTKGNSAVRCGWRVRRHPTPPP